MNPQTEFYELNSGYQTKMFRHLINLTKSQIKEGQFILDIGCASGRSTCDLHTGVFDKSKPEGETVGLDILPEMIEKAKQSYKIHEKIYFVQADIADPNTYELTEKIVSYSKGNKFDHIVTAFCLHWVKDQKQALFNIRHLMKSNPGSSFHMLVFTEIIGFYDYAVTKILANANWNYYLEDLKTLINNLLVPWKREWSVTPNPVKTYCKIMVDAGFEESKIKINTEIDDIQSYRYSSMKEMQNMIRACFPNCLQSFNGLDDLKEKFFCELTHYISEFNESNNGNKLVATIPMIYINYTI